MLEERAPEEDAMEQEIGRRLEERLEGVLSRSGSAPAISDVAAHCAPSRGRPRRPAFRVGNYKIDLYDDRSLQIIDDLMRDEFQLRRHLENAELRYPTIYCETMDEFYGVLLMDEDVSASTKQQWLEELKAEAMEHAPGGTFGVNLPGNGCYVNGWLFAYGRAENARAALRDPAIYPRIVETVAHEKLGHGFLAEHSSMGQEKTRLGMWRFDRAGQFGARGPDSPRMRLLEAKHTILYHASTFAEEGWSNWIEHWISAQFANAVNDLAPAGNYRPAPHPTLDDVRRALQEVSRHEPDLRGPAQLVLEAIGVLFDSDEDGATSYDVHAAMIALQTRAPALADAVAQRLGQSLPYTVGCLLVERIAEACGPLCTPYALLIAANVTYDLEQISVADLQQLTTGDARLNVNSRLALMTLLAPARKNDVAEMSMLAREILNLSTPANFKLDD
jgi:hypothetical protein